MFIGYRAGEKARAASAYAFGHGLGCAGRSHGAPDIRSEGTDGRVTGRPAPGPRAFPRTGAGPPDRPRPSAPGARQADGRTAVISR
ncbi:hypothetical protein GCM10009544_22160 [Streptomyces stramineus]|uniref:Uncharacterized protein n=1 Tax=Streptomyces stramineus TaxID=173861 RepID=A0ABN0ZU62_9ACTN